MWLTSVTFPFIWFNSSFSKSELFSMNFNTTWASEGTLEWYSFQCWNTYRQTYNHRLQYLVSLATQHKQHMLNRNVSMLYCSVRWPAVGSKIWIFNFFMCSTYVLQISKELILIMSIYDTQRLCPSIYLVGFSIYSNSKECGSASNW